MPGQFPGNKSRLSPRLMQHQERCSYLVDCIWPVLGFQAEGRVLGICCATLACQRAIQSISSVKLDPWLCSVDLQGSPTAGMVNSVNRDTVNVVPRRVQRGEGKEGHQRTRELGWVRERISALSEQKAMSLCLAGTMSCTLSPDNREEPEVHCWTHVPL